MEFPCAVKKIPGALLLDSGSLKWVPTGGTSDVTMQLVNIQAMQATPPTASKLRIKLSPKEGNPLMLEFGATADLERARSELQAAIKRSREAESSHVSTPAADSQPGSTAQNATKSNTGDSTMNSSANGAQPSSKKKKISLDPAKLLLNLDLQRTVLKQDPELMRTFEQVVITSGALTNTQFWSPRIYLLVAAAQQQSQTRGSYNVLSTIKPITSGDNKVNINLTREKISDLFDQYPLVRKAYNELVPRLSEGEFWQRFFMSRLFLVLKGEKIAQNHSTDALLDPYIDTLYELQEQQRQKQLAEETDHPAPLFLNIGTNSSNNPETYGNDTVTTAGSGPRNLIRSMNGLSQRLLKGRTRYKNNNLTDVLQDDILLHDLEPETSEDPGVELQLDLHQDNDPTLKISSEELKNYNEKLVCSIPSSINLSDTLGDPNLWQQGRENIEKMTPHTHSMISQEVAVNGEILLVHQTTLEFLKQFWFAVNNKRLEEARSMRTFLQNSLTRIAAVDGLIALQPMVDSLHTALDLSL